jgi:FtsP/CotA-like multicopper oxidase with cupredoxin domain
MDLSRRSVLKFGTLGTVGAAALGVPLGQSIRAKSASKLPSSRMPRPFGTAFVRPPVLTPFNTTLDEDGATVRHYSLVERAGTGVIAPGLQTPLWGYNGMFPGRSIEMEQGTRVRLAMRNHLPPTHPQLGHPYNTSTHLHGSASLPQYDGYASDVTYPGYAKTYRYPNFQPARTLWYHDHGVHYTAQNAYSGLVAMYVMHDPVERALLPQGEFDVPLVINDVMLAEDGTLGYDDRTHSGLAGDIILVNGRPWPVMKVKPRVYRFRVLNASISRSLRLTLSTGDPVHVVATDGGLMPVSRPVASWRHAGAERYEVLIDFSKYKPGTRVELRNLSNPNNIDYDFTDKVMAFDVTNDAVDTSDPTWRTIPQTLAGSTAMSLTAADAKRTRNVRLHRNSDGKWVINDTTWDDIIQSGYKKVLADPDYNDVEIWEIENRSGGWYHPLHIHLVDFQVLSRNGKAPFDHERGPKDVVYVGENETVRVLMKFENQRGRYMVHCHNLPHEDHDMMTQFSVGMKGVDVDVNDPLTADPCSVDTEPYPA